MKFIRSILCWTMAVGLLAPTIMAAAAQAAEPPASDRPGGRFDMPADQFFALEEVSRPIEPQDIDHDLMSAALFHETNRRRRNAGKPPLQHDPRLDDAARRHAESMAEHNYVAHVNPYRPERRTPMDRARLAGFEAGYISENVASHFAIRYEAGKMVYPVNTPRGPGFSYQPDGPPIPEHTYGSFASSLLDQWMASAGHRRNILADAPESFGAGCAPRRTETAMVKLFCVQLFGEIR